MSGSQDRAEQNRRTSEKSNELSYLDPNDERKDSNWKSSNPQEKKASLESYGSNPTKVIMKSDAKSPQSLVDFTKSTNSNSVKVQSKLDNLNVEPVQKPSISKGRRITNKSDKPLQQLNEAVPSQSIPPIYYEKQRSTSRDVETTNVPTSDPDVKSTNNKKIDGEHRRVTIKFQEVPLEDEVYKADNDIGLVDNSEDYYDDDEESKDNADILLAKEEKKPRFGLLLHPELCLPPILTYSSAPEFVFYFCNILNCVCGAYMLATGSAGYAWETSVKSILIEDDTKSYTGIDLGDGLSVSSRGILISILSFIMFFMSTLGAIGFYHALRPLIYINLGTYAIISLVQLFVSLSIIATPNACERYIGMRGPMKNHLAQFYTDALAVNGEELYQDHYTRIHEMQSAINCCGLDSYKDFKNLKGSPNPFRPPYSCCNGAWKFNVVCNSELDEKEIESKISQVGCEKRIRSICFNVMIFLGVGGFVISLVLIVSLFGSCICTLYHIRIQNTMKSSEVVYVERLNLFMPEIQEDDENDEDELEPGEKRLLSDTDKIRLSEKVTGFVDQIRKEYGMDSMGTKKRIIVKKRKKDKIILAPFEMKMAEKRKFSMVAGRHNYFLNRQMLKYAANIVTNEGGDETHAKKTTGRLDEKMKELREIYKKGADVQAALAHDRAPTSQVTSTWKFDRPKKLKIIPRSLIEHHKDIVTQKLERKKVRDTARKEKQDQDELEASEENQNKRKLDALNKFLIPRIN